MIIEYSKHVIIISTLKNLFRWQCKKERKKKSSFTLKTARKNHSGNMKSIIF